jgi:SAM-dependent methyltransferase
VDIAHQVVALAARLHPTVEFRQADAEQLPFDDGTFDAVVGNFALPHMGYPEQATAGWARVLRAGGHLALTMWGGPAESRVLGVIVDALQAAGAPPPADIPPGPPVFRYAADEALVGLLQGAGLQGVAVRHIAFPHRLGSPDELWDGVLAGTVRTAATITRQPPETQRRIRAAFDRLMREYAADGGVVLPILVKLAAGQKPG